MKILRNRTLLTMAGAEMVSTVGNWIAMQALYAILIFQGGGGVAESSAIFLMGMGPLMLLGPVAGWLCDRFDRRWLMIGSELTCALFVTLLIFTSRIELIYLLVALSAAAGTIMGPARSTVVKDVVAPEHLSQANAFLAQVAGISKVAGPLVGGVVVALLSPRTALVVDVVSFVISAGMLALLPALLRPARATGETTAARRGAGFRELPAVLRKVPIFGLLLPAWFLFGAVLIAFDVTAAVFVRDVLKGGIELKGFLVSLIGLGTGATALFLMINKRERNLWRDHLLGASMLATIPAMMALAAISDTLWIARGTVIAGSFLGGIGLGLANVQGNTLLQRMAPEGWLGMMNGAIGSVSTAGHITGLLLTPLLVPRVVSFGVYFGIGALLLALVCLRIMWAGARMAVTVPLAAKEVASGD